MSSKFAHARISARVARHALNSLRGRKAQPAKAAARSGSKTAKILDLLRRPGGASTRELVKRTGWQPHSLRGFLSGTVGKKMGLALTSAKGDDGERVYSLKASAADRPVTYAAGFAFGGVVVRASDYRQPLFLDRILAPPHDVRFEKLFRSSGRCRKISPCFSG
jgi:hypothetical protein